MIEPIGKYPKIEAKWGYVLANRIVQHALGRPVNTAKIAILGSGATYKWPHRSERPRSEAVNFWLRPPNMLGQQVNSKKDPLTTLILFLQIAFFENTT